MLPNYIIKLVNREINEYMAREKARKNGENPEGDYISEFTVDQKSEDILEINSIDENDDDPKED